MPPGPRVFDALQNTDLEGHGPLEVHNRRGGREAASPFIRPGSLTPPPVDIYHDDSW